MKPRSAIVVAFVVGLVVGGGGILVLDLASPSRPEVRSLTGDLDLDGAYFFAAEKSSPLHGVISAGSEIEIQGIQSQAAYVVFRTVIARNALEQITTPPK